VEQLLRCRGLFAGSLIGLQFVVLTLIAQRPIAEGTPQAGNAFATPNINHFGAVLFLAGIMSAPLQGITPASMLWGVLGVSGIVYTIVVTRRMRSQVAYKPVFEDWLFRSLLPFAACITLTVAAFSVRSHVRGSLFTIGGVAMLLLFIGIHNAWDAVTYHVFFLRQKQEPPRSE
jgi:hypothetical protein